MATCTQWSVTLVHVTKNGFTAALGGHAQQPMRDSAQYVVVECLDDLPEYPRYGFATAKHVEELGPNVRCLRSCTSLELATELTSQLNATQRQPRRHRPDSLVDDS